MTVTRLPRDWTSALTTSYKTVSTGSANPVSAGLKITPLSGLRRLEKVTGCTYATEDYQAMLEARGIVCSMSRRGNCYDNAVMESFFSTVKSALADQINPESSP